MNELTRNDPNKERNSEKIIQVKREYELARENGNWILHYQMFEGKENFKPDTDDES